MIKFSLKKLKQTNKKVKKVKNNNKQTNKGYERGDEVDNRERGVVWITRESERRESGEESRRGRMLLLYEGESGRRREGDMVWDDDDDPAVAVEDAKLETVFEAAEME
jgi:hypothetical protein